MCFSLKPKKVKYPSRQLFISAKQGELKKVIHLLGQFTSESLNRKTSTDTKLSVESSEESLMILVSFS